MSQVNPKRTVALLVGGIILLVVVFCIIMFTAGTPKSAQPPADLAPGTD